MSTSDDEDERLAQFLESEVLSETSDQEAVNEENGYEFQKVMKRENEDEVDEGPDHKRPRMDVEGREGEEGNSSRSASSVKDKDLSPSKKIRLVSTSSFESCGSISNRDNPWRIDTGIFSKVPPELYRHILKFLSSEDLVSCSLVCRFFSFAASDEALWRRLYCMRWGLLQPTNKLRNCAWKKLYIQRDEEDMVEFVRNCPSEFKEYYIQMQTAKRTQAPNPSQVNDDRMILDKTVADQVSIWKSTNGLADKVVTDHACSGETCSYHQIGDVFVCEKTGNVHVCDDTCKEVIPDPTNELLVCTISGHCFDRMLSPDDELDLDTEQQQGGVSDEAEPFLGSGRFARAYLLGYNCADEEELEDCLKFC